MAWLIAIAILFGASVGLMYLLWAEFRPVWFWTSLGAAVLLLLLILFVTRSRTAAGGDSLEDDAAPTVSGVAPQAPGMPDLSPETMVVQKATGMVERPSRALPLEQAPPTPTGFEYRGFMLYQRAGPKKGTKPSRFFSKGKPPGAQTIELPEGFEAVWDAKQKKPVLRETLLAEEEPEVEVITGATKRCSAWNSPGEICTNLAKAGSHYCAKHAHFRSDSIFGDIEVRIGKPGAAKARPVRVGGGFEVRPGTPAPKGPKPLRVAAPEFETRVAGPTHKPEKPLRLKTPAFETRVAGPQHKHAKALRLREPEFETRLGGTGRKPAKPLRFATPTFEARTVRPSVKRGRALRFDAPLEARTSREAPRKQKPLRFAEPNLDVRQDRPKVKAPPKLKGRKDTEVRIVAPHSRFSGPKNLLPRLTADVAVVVPKGALGAKPAANGNRRGKAAKAAKPHRTEVLVVRDTKRRSDFGVGEQKQVARKNKPRRR